MTVSSEINDRIEKCQKIMESDPNSQIFAALADAHRKKGELDKAFRICQNGLKIHPSYGAAHLVMAKINMDRGLYDWAEAEIKKAIELDGSSRSIDILLSEILIYKGEFVEAVKLLKKLHQSDP
jgi:tetratricopeptide (TPR) repeat protein